MQADGFSVTKYRTDRRDNQGVYNSIIIIFAPIRDKNPAAA